MPNLAFVNARAILPDAVLDEAAMLVSEGRVVAVGTRDAVPVPPGTDTIDLQGQYLAPGFIDIHIHGGDGADYMDGTPDAVRAANRAHARHGVTTVFPTTTTGSPRHIDAMLRACRDVREAWTPRHGSRVAGVHFYGPYFAPDKVGCHSRDGRRDPDADEYAKHFDLGIVRIATCAAELPGASGFYAEARRRGFFVTCGHSNANWAEMQRAFDLGMRHVDHFWCAMSSVVSLRTRFAPPMQASMEQFVLANAEMSTEVIADGRHLSPELLEFAYRFKGPRKLCLVSDCSRAMDMPPGDYVFGPSGAGVSFTSDGAVGFQGDPTKLASSVVALDHMVRHMKRSTTATLPDVIRMASLTPAELTGLAGETGSLAPGKLADVIVLDRDFNVRRTFIAGREFER